MLEQGQSIPDASGASRSLFAAIIENRAKEVGIAFFDGDKATLHLTQFAGMSTQLTRPVKFVSWYSHPLESCML